MNSWKFILLAMLCVAATLPPLVKVGHKSAALTQGMGAKALIAKVVLPAAPRTNVFEWRYPPGLNAQSYFWDIQTSTDLKTWTTIITNASGACEVTVNRTEALRLYRLALKLSP